MKRLIVLSCWIFLSSVIVEAQMIVKDTADKEIARITQSGNMGIGVNNPVGRLELKGPLDETQLDRGQIVMRNAANEITTSITSGIQQGNQVATVGYMAFNSYQSLPTSLWSEVMRLNTNGLGIGNTFPSALLEIGVPIPIEPNAAKNTGTLEAQAAWVPSLKIHNVTQDNTLSYILGLDDLGEVKKRTVASLPGSVSGSGIATQVAFWSGTPGSVSTNLSSSSNLFWSAANYRLGIGLTNPQAQLHTTGGVRFATLAGASNNRVVLSDVDGDLSALAAGTTSQYLRGDGTWQVPPTGSDSQGLSVGVGTPTTSIIDISNSASDVTLQAGTNISLSESGNTITLSAINTDAQGLSVGVGTATTSIIDISNSASDVTLQAGNNISLSETGNTITINAAGDNLGNHIATQNIHMQSNWISRDGGANQGLYFSETATGYPYVNINTTSEVATLLVGGRWVRHDDAPGPATNYVWHGLVANADDDYMAGESATSISGALPPSTNGASPPSNVAARAGMAGALVKWNDVSYSGGELGYHWTDYTGSFYSLCGVHGWLSNYDVLPWNDFLKGAQVTRAAGYFSNPNDDATDYCVFAAGPAKNFFGGNVGIGTTDPQSRLSVAGLPSGTGTALVVASGGHFQLSSSSRRYKTDIKPLQHDFTKILDIKPVSFTYKTSGDKSIGYIAEDLDELGLRDLIIYNKDGNPEAISYDKIPVYLIEIIKELKTEVADLRRQVQNH